MLPQLGQRLAASETEILDDEIALALVGVCHAAGDIGTALQWEAPLSFAPAAQPASSYLTCVTMQPAVLPPALCPSRLPTLPQTARRRA
jgi:hypothetical protein